MRSGWRASAPRAADRGAPSARPGCGRERRSTRDRARAPGGRRRPGSPLPRAATATTSSMKSGLPSALPAISARSPSGRSVVASTELTISVIALVGERPHGNAHVVAAIAEGLLVAGSMRADEQHARGRDRVGEKADELLRGRVDPVQVLDHEDQRLRFRHARDPARAARGRFRCGGVIASIASTSSSRVGSESSRRRKGSVHVETAAQTLGVLARSSRPPPPRRRGRRSRPAAACRRRSQWKAVVCAYEAQRPSNQVCALVFELAAELVEQPRLADARLADHEAELPSARAGRLERSVQRRELRWSRPT